MPHYILLGTYTDQGARLIRESPDRVDKARALLHEMGGTLKSFHLTMGRHDMVLFCEAPDDAIAARFSLMLGMFGNVRLETLKAFPEPAFREIIHSIAG